MTPRKTKNTPHTNPRKDPHDSGSNTFGTRVTDQQKEWIEKAAALKNWTASHLIRVAAIEKAAHILNTTNRTQFNMRASADMVAKQLCQASFHLLDTQSGDAITDSRESEILEELYNHGDCEIGTANFAQSQLDNLRQAIRLGGVEFMNMVIEACEDITLEGTDHLEKPIEPE